jgi:3'-phosphoadenosine 5'-phosphosulfate (PAPS) 3'-phosphatase
MKQFLPIAMDAALRAGDAILQIYARDFEVEFKADESPLTEADKAAHHIIVDALEDTGLPILSEESKAISYEERKAWTKYWLVDPLDGTKEFIKKNGEFTVNIALIDHGRPVMGVVFAPVLGIVYCGMSDVESGVSKAWKSSECSGKTVDELMASSVSLPTSHIRQSEWWHHARTATMKPRRLLRTWKSRAGSSWYRAAVRSSCVWWRRAARMFIRGLRRRWSGTPLLRRPSSRLPAQRWFNTARQSR